MNPSAAVAGVFASRRIEQGDLFHVEVPWMLTVTPGSVPDGHLCDHCGSHLGSLGEQAGRLCGDDPPLLPLSEQWGAMGDWEERTAVSCSGCSTQYCSTECRQAAWDSYHSVLCATDDPSAAAQWQAFEEHCDSCANPYYRLATRVGHRCTGYQLTDSETQVIAAASLLEGGVNSIRSNLSWWRATEWWHTMAGMTQPPPVRTS